MNSNRSMTTTFGAALDDAIERRNDERRRQKVRHSRQVEKMKELAARTEPAMAQAVEAINTRAEALSLTCPAGFEVRMDDGGGDTTVRVDVKVFLKKLHERYNREDDYAWELSAWIYNAPDGPNSTGFSISADRAGWHDCWGCDTPTEECNPGGLTVESSGEEVAKCFLAWFTRYVV